MKTPLTFLLALTFLFLFSGSVFADDLKDGMDAAKRGDFKTAYKLWLPLAEQGVAEAQSNLGVLYRNGLGVLQDYKEAGKWYRLSAEQGRADAQNDLGFMYQNGQGVLQDFKESLRLFRLSAEQGYADAQVSVGMMYDNGQGVPQDHKEAVKWWKLAAEQGSSKAQNNLGLMYAKGQGVLKNLEESIKWFRLAAEQGFDEARNNLKIVEKEIEEKREEEKRITEEKREEEKRIAEEKRRAERLAEEQRLAAHTYALPEKFNCGDTIGEYWTKQGKRTVCLTSGTYENGKAYDQCTDDYLKTLGGGNTRYTYYYKEDCPCAIMDFQCGHRAVACFEREFEKLQKSWEQCKVKEAAWPKEGKLPAEKKQKAVSSNKTVSDEFDQFEEMIGGLEMVCTYTAPKAVETRKWTYKNFLHMNGVKVKDEPGFYVKKKEGKNTFIVDGSFNLVFAMVPIKYFVDFDKIQSIQILDGAKFVAVCN